VFQQPKMPTRGISHRQTRRYGMCGRFALANIGSLQLRFDIEPTEASAAEPLTPRYNIAPSQVIPTVVEHSAHRSLQLMKWGFAPSWMTSHKGPPPINAKAETLLERPLFRGAVSHARCLIPADGFYEWQTQPAGKTKQPFFIRLRDGSVFAFAGIHTKAADGTETCALITTAPNELMAPIHNRMPAILMPDAEDAWVDSDLTEPAMLLNMLRPYPAELMEAYPVGARVGSPKYDDPTLIAPLVGA
jgi:putative SOS response-associated peptidase YedK